MATAYARAPRPPAVEPVPGTAAAEQARTQAATRAAGPPHVLLDPDPTSRPPSPPAGAGDMSAAEVADRIVATLLLGSGPILLCVPGTRGSAYQTSMLAVARAFIAAATGPVSVASIPYANGVRDIFTRFLGDPDSGEDVLALVLRRLRVAAPDRPVHLAGESQGAWLIADTLRADPTLAASVSRVALFAKPGFVRMPDALGAAREGAALMARVVEFRHTDDIVPSLFARLGPQVMQGFADGLLDRLRGGEFSYSPHHYDAHGGEAARWLLLGTPPPTDPVHHSRVHPAPT